MKPTEILSSEHRVIEQVLDCLEKMADQAGREHAVDAESARDAIDFLRSFADGCHHGKEEAHLFPALEAKGLPRNGGPTGVMIHEHETGRGHVRGMDEALAAFAAGEAGAAARFARRARDYTALLREHIHKEDHCLFSMADQMLSPEEQAALLARFDQVEIHHMGEGVHERYLELANRLADRYGVARAKVTSGCGCACGHH